MRLKRKTVRGPPRLLRLHLKVDGCKRSCYRSHSASLASKAIWDVRPRSPSGHVLGRPEEKLEYTWVREVSDSPSLGEAVSDGF